MDLELENTKHGYGVFAKRDFDLSEIICRFKGKLYTPEQLPDPYDGIKDHYVQIDRKLYMGLSGNIYDYLNHSCDPNSGLIICNEAVNLVAIKVVNKGSEITWDYSTTMDEDSWEMDCRCGTGLCREKVRDFKHLPQNIKHKYDVLGVVPYYLLKYI